MEKKNLAKKFMLVAALASGIGLAQSNFNEAQASGAPGCKLQRVSCGIWPWSGDKDVCITTGNSVGCACGASSNCY